MNTRNFFLAVVGVCFLAGSPLWAQVSGKCVDPATADVIFRGKAIRTSGVDTELEVLAVIKGKLPEKKITFKHAVAPKGMRLFEQIEYFDFIDGATYNIHARKTNRKNVLTQMYGGKPCSPTVSPAATMPSKSKENSNVH